MSDDFGKLIIIARRRAGMNQKELSEKIHYSRPSISKIEKGQFPPSVETLCNIAKACKCDLYDLIPDEYKVKADTNPYWKRIEGLSNAQRAKGMETYGQGLESNPAAISVRLAFIQEELVDALMYIEWAKDKLSGMAGGSNV